VIGEEGRREVIGEVGRREPIDDFPEGKIDRGKSFLQWFFFFYNGGGNWLCYVQTGEEEIRSTASGSFIFLNFLI
jgi:hypothetical protein